MLKKIGSIFYDVESPNFSFKVFCLATGRRYELFKKEDIEEYERFSGQKVSIDEEKKLIASHKEHLKRKADNRAKKEVKKEVKK